MNPSDGALFLTGATGFLGGQILARYLERTDRRVFALVRATDEAEATARLRTAIAAIYGSPDAYEHRLAAVPGDMTQAAFGAASDRLDAIADDVTDVVHAAASVSFADPLDRARGINVEGTRHSLEFAERCVERGGLRAFLYVSTTYVAGMHDARFDESDLDVGQGFRNSYERSKFEAERLVRESADRLPVRIFRPSIVVGERSSGWTPTFNVLYFPLKLFARGQNAPIVPVRRETIVDAVPVDFVADAFFELAQLPDPSGETLHLVAGPQAGTAGELLDTAARYFGRRPPTLIPLALYMRTLHPVLSRVYRGKRKKQIKRATDFLPYFSMRQSFGNDRTQELLAQVGLSAPPLSDYVDEILEYAVAAEWGRKPMTRVDARARREDGHPGSEVTRFAETS
jgi:thioester reductase-like protein